MNINFLHIFIKTIDFNVLKYILSTINIKYIIAYNFKSK